ncbi:hypothetical protein Ahy_A08g037567 isoform C [Arachis hypogaea]|uniref:Tetrapyrrole methylase domain-containing protein n=1 Tax=Arachis hypogaea TaxID=3818 RepID=A0A445BR61_ARAHY|nr:hypothetical protein Ahy_A08g037567 isoform C [Arachis hypogaea]
MMLSRRVAAALPFRFAAPAANQVPIPKYRLPLISFHPQNVAVLCSRSNSSLSQQSETEHVDYSEFRSQQSNLKPGLYLVGTPIGNLEDITFRALRVLNSANVILSEDTRHSGKLLHHYNIKTPLMSYHKFNESQREQLVLKRLKEGEIVALISDAGTPGISDPGMELAKLCVSENILVVPIPGPCALVSALSASGLPTHEFTFVGFLPKHSGSRRKRLMSLADQTATQIFYVPPHKLSQFLEEASSIFGDARQCVIAREMTKLHEERGYGSLTCDDTTHGGLTGELDHRTPGLKDGNSPKEDENENKAAERALNVGFHGRKRKVPTVTGVGDWLVQIGIFWLWRREDLLATVGAGFVKVADLHFPHERFQFL